MRRDSREHYEQQLVENNLKTPLIEQDIDGNWVMYCKEGGYRMGNFYKAPARGHWHFIGSDRVGFSATELMMALRKVQELNMSDRGVEKIHGNQ